MEKVMVVLQTVDADEPWCARIRGEVADELLDLDLPGVAVNVCDTAVHDTLMRLTTLSPPAVAVVSLWAQQSYGAPMRQAIALLDSEADSAAAYLVTESVPLGAPDAIGRRTPGLANVALLRRPAALDEPTWLHRWQIQHTPVALATQATFGYTQNVVARALTAGAPAIDGVVEELFPDGAGSDLHTWYGARDDAELQDRLNRMMASVSAFGAHENIDTVPTSRYVLRSPFAVS